MADASSSIKLKEVTVFYYRYYYYYYCSAAFVTLRVDYCNAVYAMAPQVITNGL